jgi:hypothetical protein
MKQVILNKLKNNKMLIKDPIALFSAGWLYDNYDIRVICLIRNPLGFVGSLKKANWNYNFSDLLVQDEFLKNFLSDFYNQIKVYASKPHNIIDNAILLWNIFFTIILKYKKTYPSWYFVRHEDIALNPIEEFKKIFHYLNIPFTMHINDQIIQYTKSKKHSSHTTSFGPRDAKEVLNNWRHRLTITEIDRIIQSTGQLSKHFYHLDNEVLCL